MDNQKNYYQLLHVQPDAPVEVIRSSYRTMMQRLKMHPDLGGDHQQAALVNEAYAVLMNPAARKEYDASLEVTLTGKQVHATVNRQSDTSTSHANEAIHTDQCPFCQLAHGAGDEIDRDSVCTVCGSTLFPANKQKFENSDQRMINRINKKCLVTFYTDWPDHKAHSGQTQDVSLNGLQLLTNVALREDQIVQITSEILDAVARVVNIRENRSDTHRQWCIGLEFLTLRFHRTHGTFVTIEA